jgi:hypothetical protein
MSRFKTVNGVKVFLTVEQNAERDTEEAQFAAKIKAETLAKITRDLSPSEFRGMLASEELLGDVWDAMRADLKGKTDPTSKDMRFALAANRSKSIYNLTATLAMVGSFRTYAQSLYPDTDLTDGLSDATITAAWKETVARVAANGAADRSE